MDSNTHSTSRDRTTAGGAGRRAPGAGRPGPGPAERAALAERVRVLRQLAERLEGHWLGELADLDARGAAGAEEGVQAGSTAGWLRHRLHMSPSTAAGLCADRPGAVPWPPHRHRPGPDRGGHLPGPRPGARPRHPGPARSRRRRGRTGAGGGGPAAGPAPAAAGHRPLRLVADPDGAQAQAERRYQRRGLWLSPTWEGMVAVNGLLDPEAGQTLLAALEPLARPTTAARQPLRVASAAPMP